MNYYQNTAISTSDVAVDASSTILDNPALAGALLSGDSPLSDNSQAGLMTYLIHQAQGDFISGTADFGSSSMQLIGHALATTGYAASTTGLGAEAGIPLAALGNAIKYAGVGLEIMMDKKRNNYPKVYYNVGTNMAMYGVSKLGNFVPGPYNASFNLLLLPVNATLGYGAGTLNSRNSR